METYSISLPDFPDHIVTVALDKMFVRRKDGDEFVVYAESDEEYNTVTYVNKDNISIFNYTETNVPAIVQDFSHILESINNNLL